MELISAPKKKAKRPLWGEPGSKVKRTTEAAVHSAGKRRKIVVAIYPDGVIGTRLLGTRREYYMFADDIYRNAVTVTVAKERAAKKKAKKG
jgi:hypothetical protein